MPLALVLVLAHAGGGSSGFGGVLAAAEAADDDPAFAADRIASDAEALFAGIQQAWDARDRTRLRELIGGDLLVE